MTGWALVYLLHVEEGFRHLLGGGGGDVVDALNISLVTLTTLDFADITPEGRLAPARQPARGAARLRSPQRKRLVAAVDLSRPLAAALAGLRGEPARAVGGGDRQERGRPGAGGQERAQHGLGGLVAVERDFVNFPITYYFVEADERFSLAAAAPHLLELAERGAAEDRPEAVRWRASMLGEAFGDLAATTWPAASTAAPATPAAELLRLRPRSAAGFLAQLEGDGRAGQATPSRPTRARRPRRASRGLRRDGRHWPSRPRDGRPGARSEAAPRGVVPSSAVTVTSPCSRPRGRARPPPLPAAAARSRSETTPQGRSPLEVEHDDAVDAVRRHHARDLPQRGIRAAADHAEPHRVENGGLLELGGLERGEWDRVWFRSGSWSQPTAARRGRHRGLPPIGLSSPHGAARAGGLRSSERCPRSRRRALGGPVAWRSRAWSPSRSWRCNVAPPGSRARTRRGGGRRAAIRAAAAVRRAAPAPDTRSSRGGSLRQPRRRSARAT